MLLFVEIIVAKLHYLSLNVKRGDREEVRSGLFSWRGYIKPQGLNLPVESGFVDAQLPCCVQTIPVVSSKRVHYE